MQGKYWIAGLALAVCVLTGAPALAMDGIGGGTGGTGGGGGAGGGWIHPTQGVSGAGQARAFAETLLRRLHDGGDGPSIWGAVFGSRSNFEPDGADIQDEGQAGVIGGDIPVGEGWRIGLAAGTTRETVDADPIVGSARADGWIFGAYAGGKLGPLDLRLGIGQSKAGVTTRRLAGAVTLTGDYDLDTTQVFGELALPLEHDRWTVEPFLAAGWTTLKGDAIAETGGVGAVSGRGLDFGTGYSDVGVRFSWSGMGNVAPRLSLAWRQTLGDDTPVQILDDGVNPPAPQSGPSLPDSSAVFSAGVGVKLGAAARLNVDYDASFSDELKEQALRLQFVSPF